MDGWIKIYRKMLDWEWYRDVNTKSLFLHLLLTANTRDREWHGIPIKKGQVATSLSSLSRELGMSVQNVRTSLAKLKLTRNLTSESTNKLTIITICKFEDYQDLQQANQQAEQHATQQQTNNKQEDKKIRNINPPSLSNERVSPLTGGTPTKDEKESFSSTANPDNTIPPPPSLESRSKRFYDSLIPFVERYGKAMIREFYDYWSEADRAAKPRMRFEKEKSWELDRRLGRWERNNQKPASGPQPRQPKPSKLDQYKEVARQLGIYQDGTEQSDIIDEQ